jgi:hypothetical protein
MELDRGLAGPFNAVQAEVVAYQAITRLRVGVVGRAEDREGAVGEEDQLAARA